MLVGRPFDFALVVRSRRRNLKLRQIEVARQAGVSREWLIDLEHGKPTLEFGKVLKLLETLDIPISLHLKDEPPAWSIPLTAAAANRARRADNLRRGTRPRIPRPDPAPRPGGGWAMHEHERQALARIRAEGDV